MAEKQIPQMIRATEAHEDDLLFLTQPDATSDTGYISRAGTVATVADEILNGIQYATELITPNKTVLGAINDAYNHGGGGEIDWDKLASLLVLDDGFEEDFLTTSDEDVNMIADKVIEKNIYSTEETIIGRWIGKPLYRKVIEFGSLPNRTIKKVPTNVANINEMINNSGFMSDGSSYTPLPSTNNDSQYSVSLNYDKSDNTVYIGTGTNLTSFQAWITIEYTKTTD